MSSETTTPAPAAREEIKQADDIIITEHVAIGPLCRQSSIREVKLAPR